MAPRKIAARLSHIVALVAALSLPMHHTAMAATFEPAADGNNAEERARAKFQEGSALYSAADYSGAIEAFTEALKIATMERMDPAIRGALLLNLAKAHVNAYEVDHDASHIRQAKSIYSRVIREHESEGVYEEADLATAHTGVEETNAILENLEEEEPEQPEGPAGATPMPAGDDGAKAKKLRNGGIALTVTGGVLMAGGAALAAYGSTFRRSFEEDIEAAGNDPADYKDEIDAEASRGALVGGLGGGIIGVLGVAGLVTGIVLLVKSKDAKKSSTATLTPTFSSGGAGFSLTGRF